MLESLHISHYVLIDSLDIEFPEGLVVITGATGAGKSILIGALGLLCGTKADASIITPGSENCVVEGVFHFENSVLEAVCRENDVDYNGGSLTVRRVVSASGRSRSFINDEPVTLQVLEQTVRLLLDIHSQHDTMLLTDRKFQLSVLDAYAGNASLLESASEKWRELSVLDSRIRDTEEMLARAQRDNDYNTALLARLEEAGVHPGEIARLEAEQYTLSHMEQVKELLSSTLSMFDSDDTPSVNASLVRIGKNLSKLAEFLPSLSRSIQDFENSRLVLKDICEQIQAADRSMSCDSARLQSVDDRLSELYALLKRYSCASEEELISKRENLKEMVSGMDSLAEKLDSLKTERSTVSDQIESLFSRLHENRVGAAESFALAVKENLSFLELEKAEFALEIKDCTPSASGRDELCFMFSATGSGLRPVAKCASGGELSRIMLSLKQFMSNFMSMPTIIFDEIDTGVSGSAADRMGRVICNMGNHAQVFAITHLPQVAAKGQAHYLVRKTVKDDRGSSTLEKISGENRVMEIARMLSGESTSPQAIANAKSLLGIIR